MALVKATREAEPLELMKAYLLMSCILVCAGCGQDDTAPPTIDPESYVLREGGLKKMFCS